jgi:DNA-binding transcriptional ArsR family regulator
VRPRAELHESAALFAALGDETRLRIVGRLAGGAPLSISRLAEGTTLTRQAITKHLHVLEDAQLIRGARQGREQLWALNPRQVAEARRALDRIANEWDARLLRLKHTIEAEERD